MNLTTALGAQSRKEVSRVFPVKESLPVKASLPMRESSCPHTESSWGENGVLGFGRGTSGRVSVQATNTDTQEPKDPEFSTQTPRPGWVSQKTWARRQLGNQDLIRVWKMGTQLTKERKKRWWGGGMLQGADDDSEPQSRAVTYPRSHSRARV